MYPSFFSIYLFILLLAAPARSSCCVVWWRTHVPISFLWIRSWRPCSSASLPRHSASRERSEYVTKHHLIGVHNNTPHTQQYTPHTSIHPTHISTPHTQQYIPHTTLHPTHTTIYCTLNTSHINNLPPFRMRKWLTHFTPSDWCLIHPFFCNYVFFFYSHRTTKTPVNRGTAAKFLLCPSHEKVSAPFTHFKLCFVHNQVVDRFAVILEIFSLRAQSKEAKLQV